MTCFATCCGFLINYFFSLPHPASHTPALSSDIQIQSQKGQQSNDDQLELTESNQVSSRWIRMPHPKWWMFLSTCWCRTGKIKEEQKKEKKEFDCTFEHSLMWFSSNWHSNKESTHTHTHTQTHTRRKNRATSTKPASALRFCYRVVRNVSCLGSSDRWSPVALYRVYRVLKTPNPSSAFTQGNRLFPKKKKGWWTRTKSIYWISLDSQFGWSSSSFDILKNRRKRTGRGPDEWWINVSASFKKKEEEWKTKY